MRHTHASTSSRLVLAGLVVIVTGGSVASFAAQEPPHHAIVQMTVEDELGGVLVGATVTLLDGATQQTHEAVTDHAGRVSFELGTGEYTLRVASPGFKTLERRLTIGTDRPKPLKLQLQIDVSEDVVVAERKKPLPQRQNVEENADAIPIDDDIFTGVPMPIGGDRIVEFLSLFLSPAAGKPSLVVDGQEVSSLNLPPKAIDKLVVNKNPYSPEYRRPGKARIEVVSKAGAKTHNHANVSMAFSDAALSASSPFLQEKPNQGQWLGDAGFSGPLGDAKATYLFAGSINGNRTSAIVNALKPDGAFTTRVPARHTQGFGRARLDLRPSDRAQLTFKYDYERKSERNHGVGGLALPELAQDTETDDHALRFNAHTIFSASLVNDTRVSLERSTDDIGSDAHGRPMILVHGAFQGGVNQDVRRSRSVEGEVQTVTTYYRGAHTIRFGGRFHPQFVTMTDATNFGGTFEFSNLDMFGAGRPFVYRVNQGTPRIDYRPHVADAFVQDEIKLRRDFSLMLGARYDRESYVHDDNNVAPRVAFAFAPGTRTTSVRGGVGVFYERLGSSGVERVLLLDGNRTRTLVITDPSYPNPFDAGTASVVPSSRYQLAPNLSTGSLVQSSISLERELRKKTNVTVEYSNLRGVDLFRVRDLNAPLPGTSVRPDPTYREIIQIESTGSMTSHAVSVTFHAGAGAFEGSAIYTYARAYTDTPGAKASGSLAFTLPVNNYDPGAEWGRADFDIRHRFSLAGVLELPLGLRIGSILEVRSGKPYEITTGFDDNVDTHATDRPAGFGRNAGQMPGFGRLDIRLTKLFRTARPLLYPTAKPAKLAFSVDALNALNRVNYREIVGVQSSPLFGRPIAAEQPRSIQFAMSYSF
jgi:hypothetical protein